MGLVGATPRTAPILDALQVPEIARANRDFLRGVYGVIKDCDAHVRFAFLTGVSKFPKVSLFSGLNNLRDIARYEGYYASVFYSYFAALGLDVAVEDSSSHGRVDMAAILSGRVYLFEFKVVELAPEGRALTQLTERRYADKYRHLGVPIHLVGVEFSRESRNIVAFETEEAETEEVETEEAETGEP